MTRSTVDENSRKLRKLFVQLVSGALVGGVVGYFGMSQLDPKAMQVDQILTSGVGIIYLLTGGIVGLGLLSPKLGSKFLNVEDAEEISEQRRVLSGSTISMVALGLALIALANAGPDRAISPTMGFLAIVVALFVSVVVSFRDWKYYDEMMRALSRDAGNIAFCLVGSVILLWGAAASIGMAVTPTPLMLVSLVSGGLLLAAFVAAGRAGLMMPR